jgi:hypothetical protein
VNRRLRFLLLGIAAVAAMALAGCADKSKPITFAETEGIYLNLDKLEYQVEMSRILNPADAEDASYLKGLPAGQSTTLGPDEVWFGIWLRVQNDTKDTLRPADTFTITDTLDHKFSPVALDPEINVFAYHATPMPPGALIPALDSAPSDGPIGGSLILFKLNTQDLFNRPMELHINRSSGGTEGIQSLDL